MNKHSDPKAKEKFVRKLLKKLRTEAEEQRYSAFDMAQVLAIFMGETIYDISLKASGNMERGARELIITEIKKCVTVAMDRAEEEAQKKIEGGK